MGGGVVRGAMNLRVFMYRFCSSLGSSSRVSGLRPCWEDSEVCVDFVWVKRLKGRNPAAPKSATLNHTQQGGYRVHALLRQQEGKASIGLKAKLRCSDRETISHNLEFFLELKFC